MGKDGVKKDARRHELGGRLAGEYLVVTERLLTSEPSGRPSGVPAVQLQPAYVPKTGLQDVLHEVIATSMAKQSHPLHAPMRGNYSSRDGLVPASLATFLTSRKTI
ncbi:hypothetical protein Hypma_016438 [Hypsizygus marmoreus]|uniref:Uncharacterized protein n=1 Tax=Hypsizygus marmoreus TaxID=39966 RepID=A0A369J0C7_HYPMA|nr:hypothetical protein Hypma_016438 [Hypsizygus marmoreus]